MNPWRRTTAILLAALGATIALGLPADASERHSPQASPPHAPQIVHNGPVCFAGATAQQVSRANGD
jgi:hypothetical protein